MLKDGLITLLTSDVAPSGGVHKDALPRDYAFPAIVLHQYNGSRDKDFDGPTGPEDINIQLDCYGKTQDERDTLTEQVKVFMDAYAGTLPGGTVVQACYRERGPQDLPFMPSATQKGPGYRSVMGYRVVVEAA